METWNRRAGLLTGHLENETLPCGTPAFGGETEVKHFGTIRTPQGFGCEDLKHDGMIAQVGFKHDRPQRKATD